MSVAPDVVIHDPTRRSRRSSSIAGQNTAIPTPSNVPTTTSLNQWAARYTRDIAIAAANTAATPMYRSRSTRAGTKATTSASAVTAPATA
jgi:hypothetical protein